MSQTERMSRLRWIAQSFGALTCVSLCVLLVGVPAVSAVLTAVPTVVPGLAPATTLWLPPIASPLRVSGPYLAPPSPYASGHRGIDLPAEPGDVVFAPAAGTVSFVGRVADRPVLSIRIDERTVVSFEPLDAVGASGEKLTEGDSVHRGQLLGAMAEGGHCASECVHLGVRVDGEYVNPMRFFAEKPVLLPW